jgi:hypothetical protein
VSITGPKRSSVQNAKLHALLSEIAGRRKWAGQSWDVETWKRLLTAAWGRATGQHQIVLPAIDGHGIDVVYRRTSELSSSECSDLIEFVIAWDAVTE